MATRLSPTLSRRNTPSPARSSEMKRSLRACAFATERRRRGFPAMLTSPVALNASPASARTTSMAPDPTCPARQITAPRGAMRLKFCTSGGTQRLSTTSIGPPVLLSRRGYISAMLPPADAELRYRCLEREIAQAHRLECRTRALAQLPAAVEERRLAIAEPDIVEH